MDKQSAKRKLFTLILLSSAASHSIADSNSHEATWDHFYIGSHINGSHYKANIDTHSDTGSYFITSDYAQLKAAGSGSPSGRNGSAGINIGWNYAWNGFIFGIEADYLDADKTLTLNSGDVTYITQPAHTFQTVSRVNIKHTLSLRPKLGYRWRDSLLYVTGGLSLAKLDYRFDFSETFQNQQASASKSDTQKGWTIGASMEHALDKSWSVKVEYLYSEFDTLNANSQLNGYPDQIIDNKVKIKISNFRVGINYWF